VKVRCIHVAVRYDGAAGQHCQRSCQAGLAGASLSADYNQLFYAGAGTFSGHVHFSHPGVAQRSALPQQVLRVSRDSRRCLAATCR
jgi:hypothetical protein